MRDALRGPKVPSPAILILLAGSATYGIVRHIEQERKTTNRLIEMEKARQEFYRFEDLIRQNPIVEQINPEVLYEEIAPQIEVDLPQPEMPLVHTPVPEVDIRVKEAPPGEKRIEITAPNLDFDFQPGKIEIHPDDLDLEVELPWAQPMTYIPPNMPYPRYDTVVDMPDILLPPRS